MIAILCPGQGSQAPGMLNPWLELPAFRDSIEAQAAISGLDLIAHGTTSDADKIRNTAIAQPLIVASSVASFAALLAAAGADSAEQLNNAGFAGHSVGEVAAAVLSGVMTYEQGISFVTKRGSAMAEAAALESTSMAAVIGGEQDAVEAKLAEYDLSPANYNGGGQIVAAGRLADIERLVADAPASMRVVPIQVAGAFHTKFMQPAVAQLAEFAQTLTVADPHSPLWTNAGGRLVGSGSEYLSLLVQQVSSPVRWDLCMSAMLEAGVTAVIELAPAGTLTGLAKRSMPGVELLAVKTPENLEAALSLINNHA